MKAVEISNFLQERIDAGDFPSAVYLVAEKGDIVYQDALGLAVVEPEKIKAQADTIYDLASLTKPLVTGLLCAKLIEKGEVYLSDKIAKYLTEFDREDKREITVENLLAHTSGFQSWFPFYLFYDQPEIENREVTPETFPERNKFILKRMGETPLENALNTKVVYSDFNFITLGYLLEKIYGKALDEIAYSEIQLPLMLPHVEFRPRKASDLLAVSANEKLRQSDTAASENGNQYEKQTCIDLGFDVSKYKYREYPIWGEVHDGNCWFMGGVSGHAGLFADAADTFKIAQQFLAGQTQILNPETCELFRHNFTPGLNEARSFAFQLAETPESTASKSLGHNSFGHLGFTGTSLWIEPETERIFILLANRTHAKKLPFININSSRRRFHELANGLLEKK